MGCQFSQSALESSDLSWSAVSVECNGECVSPVRAVLRGRPFFAIVISRKEGRPRRTARTGPAPSRFCLFRDRYRFLVSGLSWGFGYQKRTDSQLQTRNINVRAAATLRAVGSILRHND